MHLRPGQPGLSTSQMLAVATRKQSRSQQLADSHSAVPALTQDEVRKLFSVFESEGERRLDNENEVAWIPFLI